MWFTSDNAGPAHPAVIEALATVNQGYAASYGADASMARVVDRLRDIFEAPDAAVHLVATGTAANALALATLCPPWSTVYCHRNSHVEEDECAAPEFYTGGAKLTLIDGPHAKIEPDALSEAIAFTARAGVHNVQHGVLSLTNATEAGTVYDPDEVRALCEIARAAGIPVHMDGARFPNALMALGCTPAELTWKAGVDVLCFGGTKNGLLGVEAVIQFDPVRSWEFELRRKRGGHLFSKHRYLSAQMEAYLADGLWRDLAGRANAAAGRLGDGLAAMPDASLVHPREANAVFARWPRGGHRAVQEAGAQYYFWPFNQSLDGPAETPLSARLVCNWATETEDIDRFLAVLSEAADLQRA